MVMNINIFLSQSPRLSGDIFAGKIKKTHARTSKYKYLTYHQGPRAGLSGIGHTGRLMKQGMRAEFAILRLDV